MNIWTTLIRATAGLLLAATLAACGSSPSTGAPPTVPPAVQPTSGATAAPTAAPTAGATSAPAATLTVPGPGRPTLSPAQPIIGFTPKGGPAGTRVEVFGSGYAPGQPVAVRLGLPSATGEALTSAFAGADGRWSASLVIPDRLPSGEVIGGGPMFLVAMDDANRALASAPFGFEPPAPAPDFTQGVETTTDMLRAWQSGASIRPFVTSWLRAELDRGRPADQLVGLHPIALNGFMADIHDYDADGALLVSFFLDYGSFVELRTFSLYPEGGQWRVAGSGLHHPQPSPTLPANELQAVSLFLNAARTDRELRHASFYLVAALREKVSQGQITDVGALLLEQNPYQAFAVDGVLEGTPDRAVVRATLYYGDGAAVGYPRDFELTRRDGGFWRIVKVSIPDLPPTPAPPTLAPYPGP